MQKNFIKCIYHNVKVKSFQPMNKIYLLPVNNANVVLCEFYIVHVQCNASELIKGEGWSAGYVMVDSKGVLMFSLLLPRFLKSRVAVALRGAAVLFGL